MKTNRRGNIAALVLAVAAWSNFVPTSIEAQTSGPKLISGMSSDYRCRKSLQDLAGRLKRVPNIVLNESYTFKTSQRDFVRCMQEGMPKGYKLVEFAEDSDLVLKYYRVIPQ